MPVSDRLPPYLNLLRPFSPLVWAAVIGALLTVMSFYFVYTREAKETGVPRLIVMWYSIRDVYGSFLGQGKTKS